MRHDSSPSYTTSGDPINIVRIFNVEEVDELVLFDIAATIEQPPPQAELLEQGRQDELVFDGRRVAAVAVDALGPSNVVGAAMPSRYSLECSISNAKLLAENLGIKLITILFEMIFQDYLRLLDDSFSLTKRLTGSW